MKKLVYLLVFLLAVTSVAAAEFDLDITPVKDRIERDDTALYDLKIKNLDETSSKFRIFSPNTITGDWIILTNPLSESQFILGTNEEKTVRLTVRPVDPLLRFGQHQIILELTADESTIKNKINVIIEDPDAAAPAYFPRVILTPDPEYPKKWTAKESFPVTLHLLNKNSLNIEEIRIKLSTSFFDIEEVTDLGPFESKGVKFNLIVDPYVTPKEDNLNIKLIVNNNVVTENEYPFTILPRESSFVSELVEDTPWSTSFKVTNPSNVKKSEEFIIPGSLITSIFTSTYGDSSFSKGQYAWNLELDPNETVEVYVRFSATKIIFIFAVIFLLIFFYKKFTPDLILKQKVAAIQVTGKEITGARIVLYLKNVTSNTISNVTVNEELPNIFAYVDELIPGSIRPSEIRVFKSGSRIVWKIDELGPDEERIITFKLKSKLRIMGTVKIPGTQVKYVKDNKIKESFSNLVTLTP